MNSENQDCEIVSSRVLDSPAELVFEAWTNPHHLQKWWGPKGFTNTFNEFDLRPGGKWQFIMHGPDKGNYVNEVEFTEIESPKLISWKRISQPLFNVLTTFEKLEENKTHMVFRMIFDTPENCNKIKKFAVDKNEENFDKLEDELSEMKKR